MTPLWIFLICFPFGAFILIWVFVTAMKPAVEEQEEDEDDILDEAPEGYLDEDDEQVIVDIAGGTGVPAPSRPQITMNSSGVSRKSKSGSGSSVSKVAKPEEPGRMTVESLKKISPPKKSDGPTVAANGMPIRPQR